MAAGQQGPKRRLTQDTCSFEMRAPVHSRKETPRRKPPQTEPVLRAPVRSRRLGDLCWRLYGFLMQVLFRADPPLIATTGAVSRGAFPSLIDQVEASAGEADHLDEFIVCHGLAVEAMLDA